LLDDIRRSYKALTQRLTPTLAYFVQLMCGSLVKYASCRDTKDATAGKENLVSSLNQALIAGTLDRHDRGTAHTDNRSRRDIHYRSQQGDKLTVL
jgi:hypothetical protein